MIKHIFVLVISLFSLFSLLFINVPDVRADCSGQITVDPNAIPYDYKGVITINNSSECFALNTDYLIVIYPDKFNRPEDAIKTGPGVYIAPPNLKISSTSKTSIEGTFDFDHDIEIKGKNFPGTWKVLVCKADFISKCADNLLVSSQLTVSGLPSTVPPPPTDLPIIDRDLQSQCKLQAGSAVTLKLNNMASSNEYEWWTEDTSSFFSTGAVSGGIFELTTPDGKLQTSGKKRLCVDFVVDTGTDKTGYRRLGDNCIDLEFTVAPPTGETRCSAIPPPASAPPTDICKKDPDKCAKAGGDPCGDAKNPGFKTAIGCIHTNPASLVKDVLTFAVAISGGLSFLMMLLGSFQMLTSAGNPDSLNAGKDRLTDAVIGLLFVIFSVLLMQIIGFDILKIPGFDR